MWAFAKSMMVPPSFFVPSTRASGSHINTYMNVCTYSVKWLHATAVLFAVAALVGSVAGYLYFGPKRLRLRVMEENTDVIKIAANVGYGNFRILMDA